jgi:ABC-type antimicrobial peptide transport system permease subunit
LTGIFAIFSVFLTAVGAYGLLSYTVRQRRREIGVRMALGATPGQIHRQFLFFGLRVITMGSVLGFLGALLALRAMRSILFSIPALPAATLAFTILTVIAITLVACLLPSRRAAQTAPANALSGD